MTARPSKSKSLPDPPLIRQLSKEEAPHLYEDGVFYPATDGAPLSYVSEQ